MVRVLRWEAELNVCPVLSPVEKITSQSLLGSEVPITAMSSHLIQRSLRLVRIRVLKSTMEFEAFIRAFGTPVACRENTVRVHPAGAGHGQCSVCGGLPSLLWRGACGSCCVHMKIPFAVCSTKWTELKLLPVALFFLSCSLWEQRPFLGIAQFSSVTRSYPTLCDRMNRSPIPQYKKSKKIKKIKWTMNTPKWKVPFL